MTLALYRIDDRLIHGQVVVGWGQPLNASFIVLAPLPDVDVYDGQAAPAYDRRGRRTRGRWTAHTPRRLGTEPGLPRQGSAAARPARVAR